MQGPAPGLSDVSGKRPWRPAGAQAVEAFGRHSRGEPAGPDRQEPGHVG